MKRKKMKDIIYVRGIYIQQAKLLLDDNNVRKVDVKGGRYVHVLLKHIPGLSPSHHLLNQ